LIDGQVVSTKYADKLYEISMREPDVWRAIKKDEYGNRQEELNGNLQSKHDEEMMKRGRDY